MKTTHHPLIPVCARRSFVAFIFVAGIFALPATLLQGQPAPASGAAEPAEDEPVVLSPFVVDSTQDRGYAATSTLAGTRIRTDLADIGSAISVLTREMITDIGGYNNETVLAYAVNTEVAGPRGNFSGANRSGPEGNVEEQGGFANPNGNTRVRGLVSADNTRDFFLSDVPWDGYNISRVDLQRGPNAILFGLGSPAGIINAAINQAQFRNRGTIEAMFDEHGTQRYSLDYNRNLIDQQLALRIALLSNDRQFQQEPAFSRDQRIFGAIKFAPEALNRGSTLFEVNANYEHGDISSNRPRQVTPQDNLSQFWRPISLGGVGKKTFDLYRDPQAEFLPDLTPDNDDDNESRPNPLFEYDPVLINGIAGGSVNNVINSAGGVAWEREGLQSFGAMSPEDGIITDADGPDGFSLFPSNGYQSVAGVQTWSGQAGRPYSAIGGYRNETITDPSVFDFYNKLLDGDNKREWSDWDVYTIDLTNTFLNNMVGYNLTVFNEQMSRGMWTPLGWEGNSLHIDINERRYDNSPNPDVGRAYIGARTGNMGSFTNKSERDAFRAQAFGAYNFDERHDGFWARLLGEHRLTAVYSKEGQKVDSRSQQFANWDPATLALFGPDSTITNPDVTAGFRYYVSDDLRGRAGPTNLNLEALSAPFAHSGGGLQAIRWFDPTWTAPSTVNPNDPWDNPMDPDRIFSATYTQSENPANYRGWRDVNGTYITLNSSTNVAGMSARDYLTSSATLTDFEVKSQVGVWQGTFWDHAVVGVFGYRKDKARKYEHVTSNRQGNENPATGGADLNPATYNYNNPNALVSHTEAITRNWSVMLHVNKLLGSRDVLPVNLRLYYNRGENFQPLAGRIDAFGLPVPNPGGTTKDMSVMVSTKDDRFSLRVTKYETLLTNATSTDGQLQNTWALEQALGADLGDDSSTPAIIRGYLQGEYNLQDYADQGGDVNRLQTSIIPAWLAFEKELKAKFPEFVRAWMGADSPWGTDSLETPIVHSPTGFVATEDSTSEGYEMEFIANPTNNWRIAINGSRTVSTRDKVPGENFRQVGEFVDNAFQTTDAGLAPVWWPQNTQGLRGVGPYPFFFRSDWLRVNSLNGQAAPEIRKYRANLLTNYEFSEGRLKGFGVGTGYRWEDKSILAYAPMIDESGTYGINLNAPFFAPAEDSLDVWFSYRRKLTDKLNWRIQLNLFNVGEKNRLVPLAAGVDYARLGAGDPTAGEMVPMKATSFFIREGMSWQITNTIEF